jgi:hypothetical protein
VLQSAAVVAVSDTRKVPDAITSASPRLEAGQQSASRRKPGTPRRHAARAGMPCPAPRRAAAPRMRFRCCRRSRRADGSHRAGRCCWPRLNFSFPPDTRLQSGRVRVRILLDDKGEIEEVRVVAAAPPGSFRSRGNAGPAQGPLCAGIRRTGGGTQLPLHGTDLRTRCAGPATLVRRQRVCPARLQPALKPVQDGPVLNRRGLSAREN